MNDAFTNGKKWHQLHSFMIELSATIRDASVTTSWRPTLRSEAPWDEAWEEWEEIESLHEKEIWEAARQLVTQKNVENLTPETCYYLDLRVGGAKRYVADSFVWKEGHPASLIPFPDLPLSQFTIWLLTEWANDCTARFALAIE